jgi:hypothetical protein
VIPSILALLAAIVLVVVLAALLWIIGLLIAGGR